MPTKLKKRWRTKEGVCCNFSADVMINPKGLKLSIQNLVHEKDCPNFGKRSVEPMYFRNGKWVEAK